MTGKEKLRLFRRFFTARSDVYAYRLRSNDYLPPGLEVGAYVPRRAPRYKLTDYMIIQHMNGSVLLGAYPLQRNGFCPWIAADFDAGTGNSIDDSLALATALRELKIEPLCNMSKSGRGVHVRLILKEPIQAWILRRFMNVIIFEQCGLDRLSEGGSFDRCFPAQDVLFKDDKKAIGNQIVMPLNMKAAERGGCLLLDRQFNPIPLGPATWDFLEMYEDSHLVTRSHIMRALLALGRVSVVTSDPEEESVLGKKASDYVPTAPEKRCTRTWDNGKTLADLKSMVAHCAFFHYAAERSLSYFEWLALATNLAPFDHCGGRETFHEISQSDTALDARGHPRYEWRNCEQKFEDVVHRLSPITCSKIAKEGWQCPYLGHDGQCNKFRLRNGRGPKAPVAVSKFLH